MHGNTNVKGIHETDRLMKVRVMEGSAEDLDLPFPPIRVLREVIVNVVLKKHRKSSHRCNDSTIA